MDLGRAYTKKDEIRNVIESNIKDEFVINFLRENGRVIYKVKYRYYTTMTKTATFTIPKKLITECKNT